MKKVFTTLFALFAAYAAIAQMTFTAGVNASLRFPFIVNQNAYGGSELDYKVTLVPAGGAKLGLLFSQRRMGIFTELNYAKYGQKYFGKEEINGSSMDIERDVNLTYMEVPIYFRFTPFKRSRVASLYMEAGPQLLFLTDASISRTGGGQTIPPFAPAEEPAVHKDAFNSSDFGLCLGLGYLRTLMRDRMEFTAGLRAFYGFTDINADKYHTPNKHGVYEGSKNFTAAIQLSWAYYIGGNSRPGKWRR